MIRVDRSAQHNDDSYFQSTCVLSPLYLKFLKRKREKKRKKKNSIEIEKVIALVGKIDQAMKLKLTVYIENIHKCVHTWQNFQRRKAEKSDYVTTRNIKYSHVTVGLLGY